MRIRSVHNTAKETSRQYAKRRATAYCSIYSDSDCQRDAVLETLNAVRDHCRGTRTMARVTGAARVKSIEHGDSHRDAVLARSN